MNTANEIWRMVMSSLSAQLTQTAIETWFSDCEPVDIDDHCMVVRTTSELKKAVLTTRFSGMIKEALREIFSSDDFDLILLDKDEGFCSENDSDSVLPEISGYTFDDFVVGSCNQFAYAASVAAATDPGKKFNPLFIYGNSGLGKTHLLLAIGHAVQEQHPGMKIAYVKGESFTNEMIQAIQTGTTAEFRNRFRKTDLLLIDDIQFIAGKQATQNEFFHTFNDLYEAEKQIVVCSDRLPAEMTLLDDRLRTRFEGGLLADISPPDMETRIAILRCKALRLGLDLPEETISYIASKVKANVRLLDGVVKKLGAYREIMCREVTREYIDKVIEEVCHDADAIPTPDQIIRETAKYYSLTLDDLTGLSRTKNITLARQLAMYLIRRLTSMTLEEIGKVFNRDHATVMNALRKIEGLLQTDLKIPNVVRDIESNIANTGILKN